MTNEIEVTLEDLDEKTDALNNRICVLVEELTNILHGQAVHVRPLEAGLVAGIGIEYADASAYLCGEMFLHPVSSLLEKIDHGHFVEHLSDKAAAGVLLNLQITAEPGLPESGVNKRLALEAAERLGPDWAQALYRFAVLVTKLA